MELFSPKVVLLVGGGGGYCICSVSMLIFGEGGGGASPFNKCLKMLVNMTCCW